MMNTQLTLPMLLRRARSAYDGRLMLMKGPEAAVHHPHPSDRVFRDLDPQAATVRNVRE